MVVLVTTESTQAFDKAVTMWAYKHRTMGMNTLMEGITYIGNWSSIVVICILLLAFESTRHTGICVSLATTFTWLLNKGIQHVVMRERPEAIMRLIEQGGPSFPSAHAASSMALFITIAICLVALCRRKREMGLPLDTQDRVMPVICVVAPLLIAFSRVYLGVHWATDVIAGVLEGLTIAMIAVPHLHLFAAKIEDAIEVFIKKNTRETADE